MSIRFMPSLKKRPFVLDELRCGGRMKIIAALTEPVSIRAYLEGVGLPARPPPTAPAAPRPQHELEFAA